MNNFPIPGETPMLVSPTLALLVGVDEAILLGQIHELGNGEWVTRTLEQWLKALPFYSLCTIRRIIRTLEESELVEAAQRSSDKRDRTKSYRVNYQKLSQLKG